MKVERDIIDVYLTWDRMDPERKLEKRLIREQQERDSASRVKADQPPLAKGATASRSGASTNHKAMARRA